MPKMNGEKFPYPKSGMQPAAQDRLNPPNGGPAKIPGGVNDIYQPEVSKVASTSIYLPDAISIGGGANDITQPSHPKVAGGNKDIYLQDNEPV
jgi:lysophospholipase L1-like esterase